MYYYAKIIKQDGDYVVSFPDMPGALTFGETIEDAIKYAGEALNGVFESTFERGYKVPKAKEYKGKNFYRINLYPHVELSYKLRTIRADKTQIDIAKELGISYQAYQKLENPRKCNPTIKTLEKIAKVFKKELVIGLV